MAKLGVNCPGAVQSGAAKAWTPTPAGVQVSAASSLSLMIAAILVAVTTVALRLPSCFESFWVDELHTAWTIQDGLADVISRAQIGHQQPYYFTLLWLWKQSFGESEFALRMTSVLALAATGVVLTLGVTRSTHSTIAGVAAGVFLAVEANAIFFGTELRPYAAVMLAAAACCYFAERCWGVAAADRGSPWLLLVVSLGVAGLIQLTSLGILGWLPIAIAIRWSWLDWRSVISWRKIDAAVLMVVAGAAVLLMPRHILETWNQRSIWASFASTQYIDDLWELWPWLVGLILPAIWFSLSLGMKFASWRGSASFTLLLAAILTGSAFSLWLVAYTELAPLWHRRFLIAGLPMLAWCFGTMVACGAGQGRAGRSVLSAAMATTLLVLLTSWTQSTLPKILRTGGQLVSRGEDWRGAIAYLNSQVDHGEPVSIDPGLIEQLPWHQEIVSGSISPERSAYLSYALRGPYTFEHDAKVLSSNLLPISQWIPDRGRTWMISRRPANRLRQAINQRVDRKSIDVTIRSFGRLSVARIGAKEQ